MKTSVLLSWEVPDSYKSAVPFRVGGAGWPGTRSPAAGPTLQSLPACLRSQSSIPQAWEGALHPNMPPAPPPSLPVQILYNGQSVEVDGHSMRKLIADLQPNTEYSFVLMNRGSSAGGLQHLVSIRTAPDLLPHKPLPASAYIEDGRFTLTMPHVQEPALVRCADTSRGWGEEGGAGHAKPGEDGPDSPLPTQVVLHHGGAHRPHGREHAGATVEHARGAGAGRGAWGPGQGSPDGSSIALVGCAPGTPPKLELFSDWQPARVSEETHSELAPGSFQRTPGGLTETSPEGFVEDPLGCEVAETSLRSNDSQAL